MDRNDCPSNGPIEDTGQAKAQPEGSQCCWGICGRLIRRCIPVGCLPEVKELSKLATPMIVSQLLNYLLNLVSCIFCGHLGKVELDGVTIASAVLAVTGFSVGLGFCSACDTLLSQTFGGKNLKLVGVILQRALISLILICFPCWALFINTEDILLVLRQDPEVARLAHAYVVCCIPVLLEVFIYSLQISFLQNQGITVPQIFVAVFANVLNAVFHYVFLFVLRFGVVGAALAVNIARTSQIILLFLYIFMKKLHVETWGGWSRECLQEWGPLAALAFPGILTVCFEWWIYEIGNILAGLIGVTELGAQSVMYQVVVLVYMIPYSLGTAVSVRVGNALGAGKAEEAKRSATIAMLSTAILIAVDITVIGSTRTVIAKLFTSDEEILRLTSQALLVYLVFHIFESMACTAGGVLRGIGKQKIGAWLYAVGYYMIGLPVVAALTFAAKLGVLGLWCGMTVAAFIPAVLLTTYIVRVNWMDLKEEAQVRIGLTPKTTAARGPSYTTALSEEEIPPNSIIYPDVIQNKDHEDHLALNDLSLPHGVVTNGNVLSVKQLIVRRGLVVAAAVLSLIIGILVRLFVVQE